MTSTGCRDWELWSCQARLVVTDRRALGDAASLVKGELAAIELACSRFRADSELMGLHIGDNRVSKLLAELVSVALEAARATGGAVDPTVGGALVGLGYDRDITLLRSRAGDTPISVHPIRGWRQVGLLGRHVNLPAGVLLDLGATAKAHAADRCAHLVHDRLGVGVLVALGGDIATSGNAPEGGWQIAVQDLPRDPVQQVTLAAGAAIATSSTVHRVWGAEHHIIDPQTGRSSRGRWRTATVVAPTCLAANTASTAALVLQDRARPWLAERGFCARLVDLDGHVTRIEGWPEEEAS